MQVYAGLAITTNQLRDRPAEMIGIASPLEDWTMARHRVLVDALVGRFDAPPVLDAGTGMYLNSILFDIDISPKVPENIRRLAEASAEGGDNRRRSSREKELELYGHPKKGSIWEGNLRYDSYMIYLRPEKEDLEHRIKQRSKVITRTGLEEVRKLLENYPYKDINQSIKNSVGFKELHACIKKELTEEEAEHRIFIRTRRLSVRQIRWFDKLAGVLEGRARILISKHPRDLPSLKNQARSWELCSET